ncbi:MAG: energy transducer TonB [bacterium]|nr:energy transducer TonB [bacterium]
MTAAPMRPDRIPFAESFLPGRARDQRSLLFAACVALALHVLALLAIPLPDPPPSPPRPVDESRVLHLTRVAIPPPELPPPTPRNPTSRTPRNELPVPFELEDEPVQAPRERATERLPDTDVEMLDFAPAPPPAPAAPAVYDETSDGLTLPRMISVRVQPTYPRMAILAGRDGVVILRAVITEDGEVAEVEVLRSPQPDLGFADAAREAVLRWRYEPGQIDGRPVAVALTVVVDFQLD